MDTDKIRNIIKSAKITIQPTERLGGKQHEIDQIKEVIDMFETPKFNEDWHQEHATAEYNNNESPGIVFAH